MNTIVAKMPNARPANANAETATAEAHNMVKTLGKALTLLDAVAASDHPPKVSELAVKAGLSRPTAHRLVQSLLAAGFLQQNPPDNRLTIGYAVLPLASSLLDRNRLRLEALPHLQALAEKMNERVNLGILNRDRVLVLAGSEKPSLPTIYSRFGRMIPINCSALAKAMLAYLPSDEVHEIVTAHPFVARTPRTITSIPAYLEDLEGVRARGYSIEQGENSPTASCVGAPIFDDRGRPVAAISVSGPSLEPLMQKISDVLRTAELISHVL